MGDSHFALDAAVLRAWGISMRGKITSRQKCPVCGAKGDFCKHPSAPVLVCRCNQFPANALELGIKWDGHYHRITHDQDGRRFTDYVHAERALGLINDQIEKGSFDPLFWCAKKTNKLLWENYLRQYIAAEEMRLRPDQEATFQKKRSLIKHLAWFNGKNIRDIRAGHLEDFAALPCLKMALSPKSRAGLMGELRFILTRAERRGDIAKAPQVPTVSVPEQEIVWLKREQQARLLAHVPAVHRPIFAFMITYGVRVNEACALCWDKVDLANGTFCLSRTFSRRKLKDKAKTKRPNILPLCDELAVYLQTVTPGLGRAPVFRNPEAHTSKNPNQFYLEDFLRSTFEAALAAAGLPPIQLKNATRHSRAMQAINVDMWGIEAASRLLGHTSLTHTKKYARATTGLLKELIDGDNVLPMRGRHKGDI